MLSFATCRNWAGAPGTRPPAQHDAQERGGWLTFFSYAEYELVCTVTPGDSYYVQATTWDSGDGVRYPKHFPRYPASNCVPELAGSGIDDDHYKAATFDAASTSESRSGSLDQRRPDGQRTRTSNTTVASQGRRAARTTSRPTPQLSSRLEGQVSAAGGSARGSSPRCSVLG